jgi:hypothetical protein
MRFAFSNFMSFPFRALTVESKTKYVNLSQQTPPVMPSWATYYWTVSQPVRGDI